MAIFVAQQTGGIAGFFTQLVDSIVEMPSWFADVAAVDPLSAVLLLVGALITGFSVVVFGVLSLGALVDLVIPEFDSGRSQRE
jgi:hypothetical protein